MKEVAEFYQQREGIIDVHYIKRIICTPSGIFAPASGYIARCAPFIRENSPTKCDAQLPENNFKTRSRM
ncbi:DUF6783 domain-containing protein [Robinsoniella peoriensis]|uniref:DUF6783 domain-containing protein n=1 Tax=Robinsoniella peoriensis TaxID=180332 RepID=UPI003750EA76